MAKKYYLDTAIWRDYLEERGDGIRPLGEFAFQFLRKCDETGAEIIVSNVVTLELEKYIPKERLDEMFSPFKGMIREIIASKEQYFEAKKEQEKRKRIIPLMDVLHAIIARDNKAVLIARDKHFFEELTSIVEVQKPEDLL